MTSTSIAVIGAGFSGTLLSLHLLRHCGPGTRVLLIERNAKFGHGQAYSTGNPSHLLNVPAGRMSAFHGQPGHFLAWLRDSAPEQRDGIAPEPQSFVPRRLFGAYVRSLLKDEIRRDPSRRLELVRGAVLGIDTAGRPLRLRLDRDRTLDADIAVLATGNFPPEPMPIDDPSFYDTPFYRPDPWAHDALAGFDPNSPVLLIGTGLTTVDVVISLLDQGHRGPIHALSRRGLLPRRHAAGRPADDEVQELPNRLSELVRVMRREARRAEAEGCTWQSVVDRIRPFTLDVWQTMSLEDRARFLRHLRPWWDVHRHRTAPEVAERVEAARASGQFRLRAGRVRSYRVTGQTVEVGWRPRGREALETLEVARVVNCSGPGADYDRISDPLVRSLLREGTVRPDALRLSLDVTPSGALLNRAGDISRRLFAVGPVTKAAFWEMTAVPDIRRQCELLAEHIAGLAKPAADAEQPAVRTGSLNFAI